MNLDIKMNGPHLSDVEKATLLLLCASVGEWHNRYYAGKKLSYNSSLSNYNLQYHVDSEALYLAKFVPDVTDVKATYTSANPIEIQLFWPKMNQLIMIK